MVTKILVFIQCLLFCTISYAQIDREFWFAAPDAFDNGLNFDKPIVVRLTTFTAPATVTISIPANPGFTPIITNIPANSNATVDLTTWINLIENTGINVPADKGLLITSTTEITAYYEVVSSYCNCSPEVFALKGKNALGNEFFISAQNTYAIDTVRFPVANTSIDIIATEDNTAITITPSKELIGHAKDVPFTITLNKGQTFSAVGKYHDKNSQLDGSYVRSDKPVAVTLKGDLTFGDGPCADLIGDQTIPTSVLGNEYIVTKGYLVPQDRVFIMAIEDNTSVFIDGNATPAASLLRGQTYMYPLINNSSYIRCDKKVYVYQVTGNGCELGSAIIPKLNCTGSRSVSLVRSSNETFALFITTENGNQNNFTLNGGAFAPSFSPVPGTGGNYLSARVDLTGTIAANSPVNIANTTGKFSLGFINGSTVGGCRYGFFSDFKSSSVQSSQLQICEGDSSQLNAFGGATYQWSPATGLSNTTIANPKASPIITTDYKVIITDVNGCIDSAFIKVVVKTPPPHTPIYTMGVCTGKNIKIGNGIKNVIYNWNTGETTDSIVVNAAGTYWLQSTSNVNGCSSRDSIAISLLPNPIVNIGPDVSVCKVNNVMLDAGNTGAAYLWHDGSIAQTVTVNGAGKYYVEVTDGNGCKNSDTVVLSQVLPLQADFTFKQDVCNPLNTQFTGLGNFINPGWDFGDGNTATGSANSTNTYPAFSDYTVKFSIESGGCKDTITKTITINVTDSDIILTNDTTLCLNSSVRLRALPALSFCWSPTTWLTNANTLMPTATPQQNITYYLTAEMPGVNLVRNGDFSNGNVDFTSGYTYKANNSKEGEYGIDTNPQNWNSNLGTCTDHTTGNGNMLIINGATQLNTKVWSQTITVTPNTNYAFSVWMQNVNINGAGSNPPRLQFSINGINLGNVLQGRQQMCLWDQFYSTWNSGNSTTATISIVNQNTVASGNDYALDDISFAELRLMRDSVKVKVSPKPVVDLGPDVTLCKVNNIVLDAGNPGHTYLWQDGSTSQTLTINTFGKYYVRATNANGCENSDTIVISQTQFAKAYFNYTPDACDPLSIKFVGTGAGVSNPYWSFGDGAIAAGSLTETHTYPGNANYTVKFGVEVNGCKDTITQTISIHVNYANIILTPDTTICYNTTKQLRTQPALNFCWSPVTWLSDPNSPNPITGTPGNMTYHFTAQIPGTSLVANGDFSNGSAGFLSDYSYSFPNNNEGQYAVGPSSSAWNKLLASCGDHTTGNGNMLIVNGAPNANAVIWSQSINTVIPNTDYAFIAWLQNVNVNGAGSNPPRLQFSINGKPIGGIFQSSYTNCVWDRFYIIWNSGNNTSANISIINQNTIRAGNDFALDDISFSPISILSDSVLITVDTPVVIARTDTLVCKNAQVQMQASGAATWAWTPALGLTSATISNPVATVVANRQYIVTGRTANGCTAKDTVNITLHPIPTVVTDHDLVICPTTSIQLLANSTMTSWLWTPAIYLSNPATANPTATPANSLTYSVQVTDQYNCTHVDSVHVQILEPQFTLDGADRTICNGASVALRVTGGDTYLWAPAGSLNNAAIANPVAKPDTSTLYTVYAKESTCGIDTSMQIRVNVNPTPVVEAGRENDLNCVVHLTNLHATGTPGTSYLWAPVASLNQPNLPDPVASPDTTTRYYVTGKNKYGCTSIDSVTVYVEAEGTVTFMVPNAFTPNGDGHNDCFGVKSWGGAEIQEFAIFNRWGQRVFISNNATACWDGRFKGEPQPAGGYVYIIKAKTYCGSIKRTGTLILVR